MRGPRRPSGEGAMNEQRLLQHLVATLRAKGALRTEPWKEAAAAVPRHEFLRGGFFRAVPGTEPTAWTSVRPDSGEWLPACYLDESLVTQIAGTVRPADIRGEIMREPTSSSTLPSLVLRMFEDLEVEPGMKMLEIGTGTGYSTALACRRLGSENVTSIEYDADVAQSAREALGRLDLYPTLLTGDGLLGAAELGPYDRIIATCAVHTVPTSWIEQTRPGGRILTVIAGRLNASALVRLTVHGDGTASGPVLDGHVSFMPARSHAPPPLGVLPDLSAGRERGTGIGADVLADRTTRLITQFAVPAARHLKLRVGHRDEDVVIDEETGAWTALRAEGSGWIVREGGAHPLWETVEELIERWRSDGGPAVEQTTVTVTAHSQSIRW
ncbi:ATP-grasp peptide maturase system methyltransferase [Streptomyces sp. NPDC046939]|uniref:ATP-grasp peptide maturase system methyltransferase n=1 Tax=Streptomyces sp. NPDC046939 TaxID=3155376 RepID=UPI003406F1A9